MLRALVSLPVFAITSWGTVIAVYQLVVLAGGPALSFLGLDPSILAKSGRLGEMIVEAWALAIGTTLAMLLITWLGLIPRRPGLGFPLRGVLFLEVVLGFALGALPVAVLAASHLLAGGAVAVAVPTGREALEVGLLGLALFIPAAIGEERLFRGYLSDALAPAVGWTGTILSSALVYSLVHLGASRDAPVPGLISLAVLGLGLAYAYRITGGLWVPVSWHAGWTLTAGTGFGWPVVGEPALPLLHVDPVGPIWWTGGSWGPDGSIPGILLTGSTVLLFAVLARRVPGERWSGRRDPGWRTR